MPPFPRVRGLLLHEPGSIVGLIAGGVELADPWNPPGAPEWEVPVDQGPDQLTCPILAVVSSAPSGVSTIPSNSPALVVPPYP